MPKPIKILEIGSTMRPAGAEKIIAELVLNLNKKKFEAVICMLFKKENSVLEDRIHQAGIRTVYLNKMRGPDLKIIIELKQVFEIHQPAIIHCHKTENLKYIICARGFRKIPILVTLHNDMKKNLGLLRYVILKILLRLPNIYTVSLSKKLNPGLVVSKKNFHVANGIELKKFLKIKKEKNNKTLNLICIGRLATQKNQRLLVHAFSKIKNQHPEIRLILLGNGPHEKKLQKQAKRLGVADSVVFTGRVNNVVDYLSKANFCLHCSIYEGMPLSIIEEMAAGRVILSTDVGSCSELLGNKKLIYNNEDDLINKIIYFLDHPRERETVALRLKKRSKNFSIKKMVNGYQNVFYRLKKIYSK